MFITCLLSLSIRLILCQSLNREEVRDLALPLSFRINFIEVMKKFMFWIFNIFIVLQCFLIFKKKLHKIKRLNIYFKKNCGITSMISIVTFRVRVNLNIHLRTQRLWYHFAGLVAAMHPLPLLDSYKQDWGRSRNILRMMLQHVFIKC